MSRPGSARVIKGALVGISPPSPDPTVVVFQYNPETLTRDVQPQRSDASRFDPQRVTGAPIEHIAVEVRIDATDQLANGDKEARLLGVYPQLSALECFVYPPSAKVIVDTALMATGTIEISPPVAPLILFVWGPKRVVPVLIESYNIREEAYDTLLNPIRATVGLNLRVLSYNDLSLYNPGFYIYLANQVAKEVMSDLATVNNVRDLVGGDVKFY
jgi:hypothetical protein